MRVRLSDQAEADIEAIGDYIATDSPERSATFVDELVDRCLGLADHASRYPVIVAREGVELRRCRHRSYLIFYSVAANELEVVRVIHQSRDYMRLLFPDH